MSSKMSLLLVVYLVSLATSVVGQRPFFAGNRPIGFPDTPNRTTTEGLGDRFGEGVGTTPKLPIEANGDKDFVDRLSKLPIDQQPFWFINWQALEAHRNNPQTYPQRPNVFIDSSSNNQNVASTSTTQSNSNSDSTFANRFGSSDSNSSVINSNSGVINSSNHVNKLSPTSTASYSTSTIINSNSVGDKFEDTTEDILEYSKAPKTDKVSSWNKNSGAKKPLYF